MSGLPTSVDVAVASRHFLHRARAVEGMRFRGADALRRATADVLKEELRTMRVERIAVSPAVLGASTVVLIALLQDGVHSLTFEPIKDGSMGIDWVAPSMTPSEFDRIYGCHRTPVCP